MVNFGVSQLIFKSLPLSSMLLHLHMALVFLVID